MLIRLIVGGVLALGLIGTDATAMADTAQARMLRGRTAQGKRIKIAVKQGKFRISGFKIELNCRDGSALLLEEGGFLWTDVKGSGDFSDAQFGKTDSVYFRGRFSRGGIRGRLRVTDRERHGPRCASRWVSFHVS